MAKTITRGAIILTELESMDGAGVTNMDLLQKNLKNMRKMVKYGKRGGGFISPVNLNIALTNRCNLYCIMCQLRFPDYDNRTYDNQVPRSMAIDEYKRIFESTQKKDNRMLFRRAQAKDGTFDWSGVQISFIDAESLLNPHFYEIVKWTKETFPSTIINVLSNGTIPPRAGQEDIIRHIDYFGFSIDGCTSETFEMIRTPAKFHDVMQNIKQWIEAKNNFGAPTLFKCSTVLSAMNIHELPGIVRMLGEMGFWQVYCQPMVLGYDRVEYLRKYHLLSVEKMQGARFIEQANTEADKYGVLLSIDAGVKKIFMPNDEETNKAQDCVEYDFSLNRYCDMLWRGNVAINMEGEFVYACCYMKRDIVKKILADYKIPLKGNIANIYNSKEYWRCRGDMLDGKLLDQCSECMLGASSYERMKTEEIVFASMER